MTATDPEVMAAIEQGLSVNQALLAQADRLYAAGRRETPTGVIIGRLDPQRDRGPWLELRRTGIGSSDMAAVLGLSPYRSELDVYLDKIGATPADSDEAGEAARWGNLLEDVVAREWAHRAGVSVRRVGTLAHVERRHLLCDLDRMVVGCPAHDRCALEVKTRSAWKADEWKDGALPEDVEAQTMQQLAVTGLDAIHVAALVGGQKLEDRLVRPQADYIADLYAVADQFWTHNVQALNPPDISSLDLLIDHLTRLAPEKGVRVELDEAEEREVRHLARLIHEAEATEAAGAEAEKRLKALIGDRGTDVVIDGVPWFSWRSQASNRKLDRDALNVALEPFGETVDDFMVSNGSHRVLRKGAGYKALATDNPATSGRQRGQDVAWPSPRVLDNVTDPS